MSKFRSFLSSSMLLILTYFGTKMNLLLNKLRELQAKKRIYLTQKSKLLSKEILKFIVAGFINNLSLILAFQLFLFFISYQISLILIYISGYFLTLYTSARHVFNVGKVELTKKLKYAGWYLTNCLMSYYLFQFLVNYFEFSPRIIIFIVVFFTASVSFIISRKILKNSI